MPVDWHLIVVVLVFKDLMNCDMNKGLRLLIRAMKVVEEVLDKKWRKIVMICDMHLGRMQGKKY